MSDLVDQMGGGHGRPPAEFSEKANSAKHHEFGMALHYDTGKAVLVSSTGEEVKAVWLPRTQVEVYDDGRTTDAVKKNGQKTTVPYVCVVVPDWLAKDKGLI